MSRPPGAPADHFVDAVHAARVRSTVVREFSAGALTRVSEAGAGKESHLSATFHFTQVEQHPAIDGRLMGSVWLTCQRCLKPVAVPIDEAFAVVIADDDAAALGEFGGYEPIAVDASRLDLQWLSEEQTLLALPLVPMHEIGECVAASEIEEAVADESPRQQPFGNLRDLLQKR